MIKKIILVLLIFSFISNCSFDTKSGIWTNNEKIEKNSLTKDKVQILFQKDKTTSKEFNKNLLINTPLTINKKHKSIKIVEKILLSNHEFKKIRSIYLISMGKKIIKIIKNTIININLIFGLTFILMSSK